MSGFAFNVIHAKRPQSHSHLITVLAIAWEGKLWDYVCNEQAKLKSVQPLP